MPATDAGVSAIEELTAAGVNVNVTLLFSVERYEAVIEAYPRGLERPASRSQRFGGERWEALQGAGATAQRPLWASTGTKDPNYSDVLETISHELEHEGVKAFCDSYHDLLGCIEAKVRRTVAVR